MKPVLYPKAGLLLLFLTCFFDTFGQAEFLVSINPATGSFYKINAIDGVEAIAVAPLYACFDEGNQRYLFRGFGGGTNYLYSLDAGDAHIVSQPKFPDLPDHEDNFAELHYDNSNKTLYGLHWDNSEHREYFVSIDPASGKHTLIKSIPGLETITIMAHFSCYSESDHYYTFKGSSSDGKDYLYTINALSGAMVYQAEFPLLEDPLDNIAELVLDNSSNKIFGLFWDNSEHKEYLVTIDPATGKHTKVGSITGVEWISIGSHYACIDEAKQRYLFKGADNTSKEYLYSLDLHTGAILLQTPFPVLTDPSDNIIELQLDNSTGTLYGLHWNNTLTGVNDPISSTLIKVYPNPVSSEVSLELPRLFQEISILIYDVAGKQIRTEKRSNTAVCHIQREELAAGQYFFSIVCDHQHIGTVRVSME